MSFSDIAELNRFLDFSGENDLPEAERRTKTLRILRRKGDRSMYVSEDEFNSWSSQKKEDFERQVQTMDGGAAQLFAKQLGQGVRQTNPRLTIDGVTEADKSYAWANHGYCRPNSSVHRYRKLWFQDGAPNGYLWGISPCAIDFKKTLLVRSG